MYSREDKLQIEFGLLCGTGGCPVAVEVFAGNTADPMTVGSQIDKLREPIVAATRRSTRRLKGEDRIVGGPGQSDLPGDVAECAVGCPISRLS